MGPRERERERERERDAMCRFPDAEDLYHREDSEWKKLAGRRTSGHSVSTPEGSTPDSEGESDIAAMYSFQTFESAGVIALYLMLLRCR